MKTRIKKTSDIRNLRAFLYFLPALMLMALLATGCSTTSRLAEGDILYNGMKLKLHPTGNEKLPGDMVSDMTKAVKCASQ